MSSELARASTRAHNALGHEFLWIECREELCVADRVEVDVARRIQGEALARARPWSPEREAGRAHLEAMRLAELLEALG